jgi:hypothetical protein
VLVVLVEAEAEAVTPRQPSVLLREKLWIFMLAQVALEAHLVVAVLTQEVVVAVVVTQVSTEALHCSR